MNLTPEIYPNDGSKEALEAYKEYQNKYPEDYNGYLLYLNMAINNEDFEKNCPEEYKELLFIETKEIKAFKKTAPKEKITKFKKDFAIFLKKNNDKILITLLLNKDNKYLDEDKIRVELNDFFSKKYQTTDKRLILMNKYHYVHVFSNLNVKKLKTINLSGTVENSYDYNRNTYTLENNGPGRNFKLTGLCTFGAFGSNKLNCGECIYPYIFFFAIEKNRIYFQVTNKESKRTYGYIEVEGLDNVTYEELKEKLLPYGTYHEAKIRAIKFSNINKENRNKVDKILRISGRGKNSAIDISIPDYIFKDGLIIAKFNYHSNNYYKGYKTTSKTYCFILNNKDGIKNL